MKEKTGTMSGRIWKFDFSSFFALFNEKYLKKEIKIQFQNAKEFSNEEKEKMIINLSFPTKQILFNEEDEQKEFYYFEYTLPIIKFEGNDLLELGNQLCNLSKVFVTNLPQKRKINVKMTNNNNFFSANGTILQLKNEIEKKLDIPFRLQEISIGNEVLTDEKEVNLLFLSGKEEEKGEEREREVAHLELKIKGEKNISSGFDDEKGDFFYQYVKVNEKKLIFHPVWTLLFFISHFLVNDAKDNAKNLQSRLRRQFQLTSIHLYENELQNQLADLEIQKTILQQSSDRLKAHLKDPNISNISSYHQINKGEEEKEIEIEIEIPPHLEDTLTMIAKKEEEIRKSADTQKQYEEAEKSDFTDWIQVTLKMRDKLLKENGITGPDRFTLLEYAARKFQSFYVRENYAARCFFSPGDRFPISDFFVYHMKSGEYSTINSILSQRNDQEKYQVLISGSIS